MAPLQALDQLKIEADGAAPLDVETAAWLARLQAAADPRDLNISLGGAPRDPEPIVTRDPYGNWRAGRYIGHVSFEGRSLEIKPRLGEVVLGEWIAAASNLLAAPARRNYESQETFLARLVAVVWCQMLARAARHGGPSLTRTIRTRSRYISGQLDVPATASERATGGQCAVSRTTGRDMDNAIAEAIVCAHRALSASLGVMRWETPQVTGLMPHLRAAVGSRPPLPTRAEVARVRLSPIRRPYSQLAQFSLQVAQLRGLSDVGSGDASGLLIDVAELWELFVLSCLREALSPFRIDHGGSRIGEDSLLRSEVTLGATMGRMKPDFLVGDEDGPGLVADAKYKRLKSSRSRPTGVEPSDLYQLSAYASHYLPAGSGRGLLLYPRSEPEAESPSAVTDGPWLSATGNGLEFRTLATSRAEAVMELSECFGVTALRG
jgi:5-methylcytosine-specific restriction enzyme subunit McrC